MANFAREVQSIMVGKTCLQAGETPWPVWESGLSHGIYSQEARDGQEVEWGYKTPKSSSDSFSPARLPTSKGSITFWNSTTSWDQVFIHMSLWGTFYTQTTIIMFWIIFSDPLILFYANNCILNSKIILLIKIHLML